MKLFFSALLMMMLAACNVEEIGNSKDVNPETVYSEYSITANENEDVYSSARFRFAGPEGTTLLLGDSEYVSFDGKKLLADSSKSQGVFYGTNNNYHNFIGKHEWSFTNRLGKEFKNEINFLPFTISSAIPQTIRKKDDLKLIFSNGKWANEITVQLSDTATATPDIDISSQGKDTLVIASGDIAKLKAGQLSLDVYAEKSYKAEQATSEGGKIVITQLLKTRKIFLKDK